MMRVQQLMTTKVATISRDSMVTEAGKIMKENGCGSIVIIDNDEPVGILTETDLLKKVIAEGKHPSETPVREVMTPNLITAQPTDSIAETSRRMSLAKIRRIVIVENGKLQGVVSTTDLRRYMKQLQADLMDLT